MLVENDPSRVGNLIAAARQAAATGRFVEAERFFGQAHSLAPNHPLVLNELAMQLIRSGSADRADKLLAEARRHESSNAEFLYNHAVCLRALSRTDEAAELLDRALAIEPGNMAALLERGSLEEQQGNPRVAVETYHAALRRLPPGFKPPQWMQAPLLHAKAAVEANNRALEEHVADGLAALRSRHAGGSLRRFDQCVDTLLQKRRSYRQEPTFMLYPELPAIEFYERKDFPWLDDLEAAAGDIRAELIDVLEERGESVLDPYVNDQPGLDQKYYGALNRSRNWGVYSLWREGIEYPEHIARCPKTAAALKRWPKWDVRPTALFSILAPKTRIPAHTGPVNTRLVVHLALIVPPDCGFRVGGQTREWQEGKAFVFDDSISHEAWNDSARPRAVMILDIWSPFIGEAERDLIRALTARLEEWYGYGGSRDLNGSEAKKASGQT